MSNERLTIKVEPKCLVSIGLPVYNGAQYLPHTLDALLAQSYHNFELIISDNASTDDTPRICQEYAARDRRIAYYRNDTNLGALGNFDRVRDLATGEYFMWAADHDNWEPEFISRCVELLDSDLSVVLCTSEAWWIDSNGELLELIPTHIDTRGLDKVSRFQVTIWSLDNCYPIYGLIRLSALKRAGKQLQGFAPDILLLTELSILGAFACIPERLFYLRRTQWHGDVNVQAEKLNIRIASRLPGLRLCLKLTWQRLVTASRHFHSLTGKITAIISVVLVMLVKYRWIMHAFNKPVRTSRPENKDNVKDAHQEF